MSRRVVAAVITDDGRVLLCRRPEDKRHGGLWEFPGGKILQGESILSAARREVHEELGVEVVGVKGQSVPMEDPGSDYVIEFVGAMVEGEPQAREHMEIQWVPVDEVGGFDLAPADQRFADQHLRALVGS